MQQFTTLTGMTFKSNIAGIKEAYGDKKQKPGYGGAIYNINNSQVQRTTPPTFSGNKAVSLNAKYVFRESTLFDDETSN